MSWEYPKVNFFKDSCYSIPNLLRVLIVLFTDTFYVKLAAKFMF